MALETLDADLKTAQLARDAVTTGVLRMLKAELKNTEIALGEPLTEPKILQVIRKEIKKRTESALLYEKGGNTTQAATERQEADILNAYLPASIDPHIVEAFITSRIGELGTLTPQLKGQLIRETVSHFAGQTDGKIVSDIVNRLFTN